MRRSALAVVAAATLLTVLAAPARADVAVAPPTATAGAIVDVTLKVTNTKTGVDTNRIEVDLTGEQPVATADAPFHAGWSSSVDIGTTGASKVVWERGKLGPGQTDDFVVTLTMPRSGDRLALKTVQSYSDGSTDRWVDLPGANPSTHPAPVVAITGGAPASSTLPPSTSTPPTTAVKSDNEKDPPILSTGNALIAFGVLVMLVLLKRSRMKARK